jgi:hypothetical protein
VYQAADAARRYCQALPHILVLVPVEQHQTCLLKSTGQVQAYPIVFKVKNRHIYLFFLHQLGPLSVRIFLPILS